MTVDTFEQISMLSVSARKASQRKDWTHVGKCASDILKLNPKHPEGHFLQGLFEKALNHPLKAIKSFENALIVDQNRYDAAIETANQYLIATRHKESIELLQKYEPMLSNSPRYLDMAGTVYTTLNMSERAWPLYQRANKLQPNIDLFQANMAACAVYLGKIEIAKELYLKLLSRFPNHQRNHYQLSRLEKARDDSHIEQMKNIVYASNNTHDKNIFIYYAIAKELEDIEKWDEAFKYYQLAGNAINSVAKYNIADDVKLIQTILTVCNKAWFSKRPDISNEKLSQTPIFVIGFPRTGSTLIERILDSHSKVCSVGETQYFEMSMRKISGVSSIEKMNIEMLEALKDKNCHDIGSNYLELLSHILRDKPFFIEKLPYNFLYVGFIAKAFPNARFVYTNRDPMDACFAMYKQVFTWAYKYSYSLDNLGQYYLSHIKLLEHWKKLLGDRFIDISYESVVNNSESETRKLLQQLGLEFEENCLNFQKNNASSMTASSVQVREKIHSRSVGRWKKFENHLLPLKKQLQENGVIIK